MPTLIPANAPIPIILARDYTSAISAAIDKPAIAIFASDGSSWNDFGYYSFANLQILLPSGTLSTIDMRFVVADVSRTENFFKQILSDRPWISIDEVKVLFCSILGSADAYRELVVQLGFERSATALRHLGDAVVITLEGVDSARLALIENEQFHLGALRQEETYAAAATCALSHGKM